MEEERDLWWREREEEEEEERTAAAEAVDAREPGVFRLGWMEERAEGGGWRLEVRVEVRRRSEVR